jgi:hypothetical protein
MKTKLIISVFIYMSIFISCKERTPNNVCTCTCTCMKSAVNSANPENANQNIDCLKLNVKVTDINGNNVEGWKARYLTKDNELSCKLTQVDNSGVVSWKILSSNMTITVFVVGPNQTFNSSYEYKHVNEKEMTIVFIVKTC